MEGKTIEESKAVKLADLKGKTTSKEALVSVNIKDKHGQAMVAFIDPKQIPSAPPPITPKFAGLASNDVLLSLYQLDTFEWFGFMAYGAPKAGVN